MRAGERMRRSLRRTALSILKGCGAFRLIGQSGWRRQRLLILCFHGISLEDEHEWRPYLYIRPQQLERRLEILHKGNYAVLPLAEALNRLYRADLPERSVVLTFDDGTFDFYRQAYPRLQQYGFPATVYLTTYYNAMEIPVFGLICSYMMWKSRAGAPADLHEFGVAQPVALASTEARQQAESQIVAWAERGNLSGLQKNEVAAQLAQRLGIDYQALLGKRILQLMNQREVRELAGAGVDFQLHTHRHRTPLNEDLFRQEIAENRKHIAELAGRKVQHFCYPSGVYRPEFALWLKAENILSATTCDTGIAAPDNDPLFLPRLVDTSARSDLEFESWVNGIGYFISARKRARLAYAGDTRD
jgi:peptidoglycan/xylan/chitin deacetylase (PgdA/CDA1 family)